MPNLLRLLDIFLVVILVFLPPVQSITNGTSNASLGQQNLAPFNVDWLISYLENLEGIVYICLIFFGVVILGILYLMRRRKGIDAITFEYTLVKLSRWYAHERKRLPEWSPTAFRLIFVIALLVIIVISLLPLDPLSLEKKAEGFNKSSSVGTIFNMFVESKVDYLKEDNITFSQSLSSGPIFSMILSKPKLFEKALDNLSILDGVLQNSTVLPSLSNEKTLSNNSAFISIFSAEDVYNEVFKYVFSPYSIILMDLDPFSHDLI